MKPQLLCALLLVLAQAAGAGTPRIVAIDNQALIATEEARHHLKYLASCALDADTTLAGSVGDQTYEFPGDMGLAPAWGDRPLTMSERRWVSACILARTNAFGAHVLISMRGSDGRYESLKSTADEVASHTLYEGGFFGDLFADDALAFVCVGADHAAGIAQRTERKRVCTHSAGGDAAITRCGFLVQGICPEGQPPVVNGEVWPEVIHVWLAKDGNP